MANQQAYKMFTVYANGTILFDYTGSEVATGHYLFTAQSFGNGTWNIFFKGALPDRIVQSAATVASFSIVNSWQQISYSTSQTSALDIQFLQNPRFSLRDGVLVGASIMVAVVVVRTSYIVVAKTPEDRKRIVDENKKIFLILGFILFLFLVGASLFP